MSGKRVLPGSQATPITFRASADHLAQSQLE